ncbi:MAG: tRNA (adenosine(37)-N6)-threonylcarbamoyltransferase complex transferase subunit TsaD [candidate division FCPU426 bacterium]
MAALDLILGLETSCDETAAAVVEMGAKKVRSNIISSQHATHAKYGGVVPELASREHLKNLYPVLQLALDKAGVGIKDLDGIAVTYGPGLAGSLAMGLSFAKAFAMATGLPWVSVNHLEGHLCAAFLEFPELEYPFLGLVVSGGHTSLYAVRSMDDHERLASTRDDAAGEAFDKVAQLLDLGFPGGQALDKKAKEFQGGEKPVFPSALMKDKSLDFSYSGLKTSVLYHMKKGVNTDVPAVAAAFQEAAVRPLIKRVLEAASLTGYTRVVVGGGVAANSLLRRELPEKAEATGVKVYLSPMSLCMDNGAMIAYAGGLRLARGQRGDLSQGVEPNLAY